MRLLCFIVFALTMLGKSKGDEERALNREYIKRLQVVQKAQEHLDSLHKQWVDICAQHSEVLGFNTVTGLRGCVAPQGNQQANGQRPNDTPETAAAKKVNEDNDQKVREAAEKARKEAAQPNSGK